MGRACSTVLDLAQGFVEVFVIGHIAGRVQHLDIANDALPVDHNDRPIGHTQRVANTIEINHLALGIEIGEKRERSMHGFSPGIQGIVAIQTYADYLGFKSLKRSNSASYEGSCTEQTPLKAKGTKASTTFFLPRKSFRCQSSLFAVFRVKSGATSPTFKVAVSARLLLLISVHPF